MRNGGPMLGVHVSLPCVLDNMLFHPLSVALCICVPKLCVWFGFGAFFKNGYIYCLCNLSAF